MAGTLGRAVYIMRAAICDVTACELSSMITLIHAYTRQQYSDRREKTMKYTPRLLYPRNYHRPSASLCRRASRREKIEWITRVRRLSARFLSAPGRYLCLEQPYEAQVLRCRHQLEDRTVMDVTELVKSTATAATRREFILPLEEPTAAAAATAATRRQWYIAARVWCWHRSTPCAWRRKEKSQRGEHLALYFLKTTLEAKSRQCLTNSRTASAAAAATATASGTAASSRDSRRVDRETSRTRASTTCSGIHCNPAVHIGLKACFLPPALESEQDPINLHSE
ncbi:unnamed protein product [Trichogramma brassicae]|uniref:Uncharacterized protein n=1 Tax=Trichogramma brassicae TaxID=86971 RepID=A0A6H5IK63_9HYME|nr:unnamed protein product [Trichogramma brassicae]